MDLLKLFNPPYLFASVPGSGFIYAPLLYGFFLLLFVASFFVKKTLGKRPMARLEERFFSGLPYRFREFAIVGLIFTFFRDQNIPYLGMRFLLVLIGISFLAYLLWVYRDYKKNFALHLTHSTTKKEEDKYRPRKRKSGAKKRR